MNTIYFNSNLSDEERRAQLYHGHLFLFSAMPSSLALCEHARTMIEHAFSPLDPREAEYELSTEQYVAILAKLKPQFVHHPRSKELIQALLKEMGCEPEKTYFDVPRLKSIPSDGHHPSGLTYAIHAHRDTWYSAPFCQMNWWMPIYDISSTSALCFHPRYWMEPVANTSSGFNHYHWNKYGRRASVNNPNQYVDAQPRPEAGISLEPEIRIVVPLGGFILFSGAQLHSAVPNTSGRTRFSIDFRTVHSNDVVTKTGAPNIDSAASGTTLRDFMRGTDLSRFPDEIVTLYDAEPITDGEQIFTGWKSDA